MRLAEIKAGQIVGIKAFPKWKALIFEGSDGKLCRKVITNEHGDMGDSVYSVRDSDYGNYFLINNSIDATTEELKKTNLRPATDYMDLLKTP